MLARNIPVALVVGAAGFLGSSLVDALLLKDIQVVGVDDLRFGKKENLVKAIENKDFHLIIDSFESTDLQMARLDYIFIASEKEISLKRILELFKQFKCRLLITSSVELYDENNLSEDLKWLKKAEHEVAEYAGENKLNARVLRLGPVFGPRMDFEKADPAIRLIQQSLTGDLQKEISLEFSSRALYIDDACSLAIKCIFAGATAQKIFDGVSAAPIKVSEIKQILLDPVWYENKGFTPSELPPWPTPNLEKTIKFLNWSPKAKLVQSLKQTLSYFKDSEIQVPLLEESRKDGDKQEWRKEKARELEALKTSEKVQEKFKKGIAWPKFLFPTSKFLSLAMLALITYALIWPVVAILWGVLTFRLQLLEAVKLLEKGEFEKSLFAIKQASLGITEAKAVYYSFEPIRKTGILKSQFEIGDGLSDLATLSLDSAEDTILGVQALYQGLKSVTGELNQPPKEYFDLAQVYLSSADENLSKAYALTNDKQFKEKVPGYLKGRVDSLADRLSIYSNVVKKARVLSTLLPEVVGTDAGKSYLVILQNNNELRPTGGFIGSFAKVSFEGGKLKKLEVNDTYAIDGQLKIHVEPPKDIKSDLGQKDYFLRDANWEPDFPTSARQIEWFYTKETGERVEGVVALDISAIEDLLSVVGSLDLPDYNEKISPENLFEKSISHAEVNFFPGTQAKKSFLTALTQGLLNKVFFLPNQNWPGIVASLGKSLESKHMSIYLDDPKLFSYLVSQNWSSVLPRSTNETTGFTADFLAPVEANLGANKVNYYIDRNYNLETVIGKDGEVSQRFRVSYTNKSPSDTFPAGKYKNRMRVYLPFGTKLARILWGESEITKDVSSFVDYGRSGYSFLLELAPKEQKTLVLDYQLPLKLQFVDKKASYELNVVKQAGTSKDPFIWTVTYPLNVRLATDKAQNVGPQEQVIQTDLSTDKTFRMEFIRQ